MAVLYSNNASSALSASITNSATSFSVTSGHGSKFPAISNGDYFYATLVSTGGAIEIVKVTARSTDTFTVVRGQDGTTGTAFTAGDKVELRVTKAMLDDYKVDTRAGTLTGAIETTNARIKFKAADADGGTYALLGLDWGGTVGTYKNFEVYDYVNSRSMLQLAGETRNLTVFGSISAAGGTLTGAVTQTNGMTAWSTTTPGTGAGNYHIGVGSSTSNSGGAITFGARDAGGGATAQAGIYITSDGTYGTRMYLATTDSYVTGARNALSISEVGVVNFIRARPTYAGYTILDTGLSSFTTAGNATWGGKVQIGGNGGNSGNAAIAVVQATNGNLHLDPGPGRHTYINNYATGNIYFNGGTYYVDSTGGYYNGTAAAATTSTNVNGGYANLATIRGVDQMIENNSGAYLHIGAWAVGRTDSTAVLVNTAYRADFADNLTSGSWQRITGNDISYGSYGSIGVSGSTNGYVGISWSSQSHTWMSSSSSNVSFGVLKNNNTWAFYWDYDGTLQSGTVPSLRVSGTLLKAVGVVSTTSGTVVDFNGIPSWARRITLQFGGVSTNGTAVKQIQLIYNGGTVATSGYRSSTTRSNGTGVAEGGYTTGFAIGSILAADDMWGEFTISNLTSNTWVGSGDMTYSSGHVFGAGGITLPGTLTGVRLTTVGGTNTFDAGIMNVMYE